MDNALPPHPPAFPPVSKDTWKDRVSSERGSVPLESLHTVTEDGLDLAPLYSAEDAEQQPASPGIEAHADGWDIRVSSSRFTPEAAASAFREDLEGGASSLLLRIGAAPLPNGVKETGAEAVRVRTLAELDTALEGVHLSMIRVALDAGPDFLAAAAALVELWNKRDVPPNERNAELGADPLAALARHGQLPASINDSLAQLGELAAWSAAELPHVPAATAGTSIHHDAGCTPAQEIGIALATGLTYLRAMQAAGLSAPAAAGQIAFHLRAGTDQFQEIAKLRAFRLCWQRVLELAGANDAPTRLTVSLAERSITRRDPWVNILRGTMSCFVAVTGGADSVVVTPFDSALGVSDPLALRLARNTQHVLNEEAHIGAVGDPAAGSWFVESLTQRLAEAGWNFMREVEAAGGMSAVLTSGWLASEIGKARTERESAVARGDRAIIGVTEYPLENEQLLQREPWPHWNADTAGDSDPGTAAVPDYDGGNRFNFSLQAVRSGAALRDVTMAISDGEPAVATRLEPHRLSEPYEDPGLQHEGAGVGVGVGVER